MAFYRCSSRKASIIGIVKAADALPCPALFLSMEAAEKASGMEADFSFLLARRAFAEKRNVSGKVSNEALLFLARETNFSSAVKKIGARDAGDFVLVLERRLPAPRVKKALGLASVALVAKKKVGRSARQGAYPKDALGV